MQRFQAVRAKIGVSRDEVDIRAALHVFLDSLLPSELGALPLLARRMLVSDPGEVPHAAVTLRTEELMSTGTDEEREFLRMLALVYEEASRRIAHIHSTRSQP